MVDLHWGDEEFAKRSGKLNCAYLYVGCLSTPIAWIRRSNAGKWFILFSDLPGIKLTHPHLPENKAKEQLEAAVQNFFGLANTSRPAMEKPE